MMLPRLLFFTDPARVPDPEGVAERLPAGSGIVFRAFGASNAIERGRRLREIANQRGLILLAGADASLAGAIDADGVHLPQRMVEGLPGLRAEHPRYLVTTAAHDLAAVEAAERSGAHAVFVSPVFPSNSPSAGAPLGLEGLTRLVGATTLPVYALGGVRAHNAASLIDSGVAGLAAVEALAS